LAGQGDPTLTAELRSQAERLGIAGDVCWPGFLKGEAKWAAMADADLFVLPSYSENFGIAVIEAMAAGLAVVVSDQVGIHREIAKAQAGDVVPCDSGALSRSLLRLLHNAPLLKEMGTNGKRLSRTQYSLETVTGQLIAAYSAILN
jgi:glycosyltransferase involved in cell wall biosynthesis